MMSQIDKIKVHAKSKNLVIKFLFLKNKTKSDSKLRVQSANHYTKELPTNSNVHKILVKIQSSIV